MKHKQNRTEKAKLQWRVDAGLWAREATPFSVDSASRSCDGRYGGDVAADAVADAQALALAFEVVVPGAAVASLGE